MNGFLNRFNGPEIMGLIAVAGAFGCGVFGIAYCWFISWQTHRKEQATIALKHTLIERGYAPADIQQILEAGTTPAVDVSVV